MDEPEENGLELLTVDEANGFDIPEWFELLVELKGLDNPVEELVDENGFDGVDDELANGFEVIRLAFPLLL